MLFTKFHLQLLFYQHVTNFELSVSEQCVNKLRSQGFFWFFFFVLGFFAVSELWFKTENKIKRSQLQLPVGNN